MSMNYFEWHKFWYKNKQPSISRANKLQVYFLLKTRFWFSYGDVHFRPTVMFILDISSVQFSSVAQSSATFCDPIDCNTSGFPLYHQLPELTQTHVHWVSDANQPSHPLSFPSPPASNLSQHQSIFKWVNSSHQVAKVLEFLPQSNFLPIFESSCHSRKMDSVYPMAWHHLGYPSLRNKEVHLWISHWPPLQSFLAP